MLHNKRYIKYIFLFRTIMMADALSFQVVIDLFFCTKLCFFVTKIGVERQPGLNFATSSFIYLYLQSLYSLFSTFPIRTSRGRGMTYLSPLN